VEDSRRTHRGTAVRRDLD